MKKAALLLSFAFVAAIAGAQDPAKPAVAGPTAAHEAADNAPAVAKTHPVEAVAVSADVAKKTLTIKGEKENMTVPVDDKAVASLKGIKAGDKLTLTCQDDEKGNHQKVTAIAHAKPAAPAKK